MVKEVDKINYYLDIGVLSNLEEEAEAHPNGVLLSLKHL